MRTKGNAWFVTSLGVAVFLSSGGTEAAAAGDKALKAQKIKGSIYVDVNDLNKALGTNGTYNGSSGTYTLSTGTVPQVIEKVSSSVVGIIGRPFSSDTSAGGDRYNLAHGTGVIIKNNGWIVTNAHVIDGLDEVLVVTSDGKTYGITERFSDPVSDLAVIKINANHLKPAVFADSPAQLQVGEQVVAIGTPISFSLRNSATTGVVSGLNRGVNASYKLIQTDTAINPGNSGGPLVNLKGQVVGINTMKFSAVGIENMGFSIPADTVKYVINQFFKYGEVRRASLGLDLEESWSAIVGLPTDDPLTVTAVASAEAKQAKIAEGDELYSINGKRMTSIIDINELMKSFQPGQTVTLLMQSDGDIVERKMKLSRDDGSMLEAAEARASEAVE
ncbi:trypsin-like peptidase domain-containing protein [Paenibacillus sp. P96]|uniref:Trypsin-like peptidase domain-containing protein n=1 Tax=Paenibacillus zeirhizosphaerae TaxID=2987519 RepID=A0ABT9FP45_9BACL|nr:trypsin-like peptidase domain-containing protein [Paenibacillus sp. P96]MDP4096499.1 trypsin-like peptidase domain-containing protein [Paenibacillus sp. P96]